MCLIMWICIPIIIFAIATYDKWSYKAWYERNVKKGTGYDWDGNYYNHNQKLVYYNDGCVEKIDYENLNKNRKNHKKKRNKK